jgi:hypothetical protein
VAPVISPYIVGFFQLGDMIPGIFGNVHSRSFFVSTVSWISKYCHLQRQKLHSQSCWCWALISWSRSDQNRKRKEYLSLEHPVQAILFYSKMCKSFLFPETLLPKISIIKLSCEILPVFVDHFFKGYFFWITPYRHRKSLYPYRH